MNIADYIVLKHRRASVKPDASCKEIAFKLLSLRLPGLPVINDELEVVGIVSSFDILGAIREGMDVDKIKAERIMSKEPVTASSETSVEELIEIMLENNFTIMPIMKENKLVGVLDRSSLLEAYMEPSLYRYFKE